MPEIEPMASAFHGSHGMNVFFTPRTVAVIGATENPGSVGRTLLWNLIRSPFGGTVFPVHPKRPNVLQIARAEKLRRIRADMLPDNIALHRLLPSGHCDGGQIEEIGRSHFV